MKTRRSSYRLPPPPPKKRKKKGSPGTAKVKLKCNLSREEPIPKRKATSQGPNPSRNFVVQDISVKHCRTTRRNSPTCEAEFPFQNLPTECKVKVFSFLSDIEKCHCARVCKVWAQIMRTPRLWVNADFKKLFLTVEKNGVETIARPSAVEYLRMKIKTRNYAFHLVSRKAFLKSLTFSFDLQEGEEIWLKLLIHCLHETNSRELSRVVFNWVHTPHPYMFSDSASHSKSSRILCFHKFLKALHHACPNVASFAMPFDWSPLSLHLLSLFENVKSLELYKYWVFRGVSQSAINKLLDQFPKLERLKMEVAVQVRESACYPQYTVSHKSLKELDIRESNGFFLWSVTLPQLRTFQVSRGCWSGPMIDRDHLKIPCLYTVLHDGAPNLQRYNECKLDGDWRVICSEELEQALKASCFCKKHKRGALIY
ncbi:uncharacterized protein [Amphiura filiformis]|uniref:uncharacterized protein n=1 Tax=Amphiura filiformis TaxID=82378 RepID=UPI003B215CC8